MGTYSDWEMDVEGSGPIYNKLMETKDTVQMPGAYVLTVGEIMNYSRNMKWYDMKDDMKILSRDWPNVLFIVTYCTENGKMGRHWFRNGRHVEADAVVTYPEPDFIKALPLDKSLERGIVDSRKAELREKMDALQAELDSYAEDEVPFYKYPPSGS